jgi:WD40 repeat protein
MLADTASSKRPQLRGSRYPDAALFFEANAAGTRAIVIFESGRADLVVLDEPSSPVEHELAIGGTVNASFGPLSRDDHLPTTSETGEVAVWRFDDAGLAKLASFDHGDAPVGLASFSNDGARVISLGSDGTYKIWGIDDPSLIASYPEETREKSPAGMATDVRQPGSEGPN